MILITKCNRCGALLSYDHIEYGMGTCPACEGQDINVFKILRDLENPEDIKPFPLNEDLAVAEIDDENYCPDENNDTISFMEIKGMVTHETLDKKSIIIEACVNNGKKDLYLYLEMADDTVFRACDRSYLDFVETGCDMEMYPVTIYKEIKNKIQAEDKEYFSCFQLVWDIAHTIIEGMKLPEIVKE